jgi:tetratricopeptide (TPR) repeat protein
LLQAQEAAVRGDGGLAVLLGEACLRTGDPETAKPWLAVAAELTVRASDRVTFRRAVNMQGAAEFALGEFAAADQHFSSALALAAADLDELLIARATNNLGAIASIRGQQDQALASYRLAIPAYQRLGHSLGLAECWHNIANSLRSLGELDSADDSERKAIEYAREARSERLVAMAEVGRAEVALRRRDPAWAVVTLRRAIAVFARLPDYLLEADATWLLAESLALLGADSDADTASEHALRLARDHHHRVQEARALFAMARIHQRRRDVGNARRAALEARDIFSELGSVANAEDVTEFLVYLGA